jgi:hypothetical protein
MGLSEQTEKRAPRTPENPNQTTDVVVMIRPDTFGYNPETAESNAFQQVLNIPLEKQRIQARQEFKETVGLLTNHGVTVIELPSRSGIDTPDAVFPNNWFSHHGDGTLVLYPMHAIDRQMERQPLILINKLRQLGIPVTGIENLTSFEENGLALEGTGSLILDRKQKVAFAIESPRAHMMPFHAFCERLGYEGVFFHAYDEHAKPIYHTNVIMSIGTNFAVLCEEAIRYPKERRMVTEKLLELRKEIITVSLTQVKEYGANILELNTQQGKPIIIMSQKAHDCYTEEQIQALSRHGTLVPFNIHVIETIGGGSARCMLAEVFRNPEE